MLRPVKVAGLGTYVPPRTLTNADLEKMVETSSDWIVQRTGIKERHIVDKGMGTSDIAEPAARQALAEAGITADQLGFIVVGTTTPDTVFPSTACVLQAKIGAVNAWGYDLGAACSGFVYALSTAYTMVATGACDHARAVGADVMSSIIDYTDRTTCILFGDGGGAVVVSVAQPGEPAIIDFCNEIDGHGGPSLCMPAGSGQLAARVSRDGGSAPALREAGRERGVQVRGPQDGRDLAPPARASPDQGQRTRSVRVASGEPPHHRRGSGAARHGSGEGRDQP
jgi:3-oxoacyl-[acyl-carrier-protein] synthase-3